MKQQQRASSRFRQFQHAYQGHQIDTSTQHGQILRSIELRQAIPRGASSESLGILDSRLGFCHARWKRGLLVEMAEPAQSLYAEIKEI